MLCCEFGGWLYEGEPVAVSGVRVLLRLLEARSEVPAMEADWLGRLKTDDVVLA